MINVEVFDQREVLNRLFRIYGDVDNPLFLAQDVANWIQHSNPAAMLQAVDENEKVIRNVYTPGGHQDMWFLTEDGLYEVLMQSRKPIAKQFKKKVKEILKSIRRTGSYHRDIPKTLPDALRAYATALEEKQRLKEENQRMLPKAEAFDTFLSSNDAQNMNQVAKELGYGRNRLFAALRGKGILMSGGSEHNLPYQRYVDAGYFKVKVSTVEIKGDQKLKSQTLVTAKGIDWLRKRLTRQLQIAK